VKHSAQLLDFASAAMLTVLRSARARAGFFRTLSRIAMRLGDARPLYTLRKVVFTGLL
jgi:hypothetical protein